MQNLKVEKIDVNTYICYLICVINLSVGLALIYFNESLTRYIVNEGAASLNPFSQPNTFLGYLVNAHNLNIVFQYLFSCIFIGCAMSVYYDLRKAICNFAAVYVSTVFLWTGAYLIPSVFLQGGMTCCFGPCY